MVIWIDSTVYHSKLYPGLAVGTRLSRSSRWCRMSSLIVHKIRFSFVVESEINWLLPNEMPHRTQVHVWVERLKMVNEWVSEPIERFDGAQLHTTLLQNNSILSSGGTWEPSELLSFWFACDALLLMALTPDSAPKILSRTCSHTFRHCRNSLATRRSCGTRSKAKLFSISGEVRIEALTFFIRSCLTICGCGRR